MNYEEQILELKKRIEVLEKEEHKRIVKRKRMIIYRIVKFLVVTILLVSVYFYIYNNYIKKYIEIIDTYTEKIDNVESYIEDKLDIIGKWNPF